ncbi:MAG TPA: TonB-dependent receptor [Xanthomonadales bacterium]|nr:TonB-dependent receptor [Xanthomonadales bacterium]
MKVHKTANKSVLRSAIIYTSLFFCCFGTVQAQSERAGDDEDLLLEEIVVTAQRRETNLQTTALAVSVLSGQELIEKGAFNLVSLQYVSPSVNIADFGSANVFNIRGIGRSKVDIEIPSGVVIYQDGVPSIAGYFQNEPYYDISAVEVLRGPQGTFVGKSASGGAVFIRTNSPVLNEMSGNLEGGFGNNNLWEGRGYMNISNSDTVAFRAAFNYVNRDDYYDAITGDYTGDPGSRDLQSIRLGLLWEPNDQFSSVLKFSWSDLDFGGNVTSSYGDPLYTVPQYAPFAYRDKGIRFSLDMDYEFDNGITLSSLTGYSDVDTVNNLDVNGSIYPPIYWFKSGGNIKLWSQEFNLISDEDQRFRWVLGLFLQNQKAELLPVDEFGFTFIGGDPFGIGQLPLDYPWLGSPWTKDEDDWALFAHVAFDITDALEFEAGIRYSDYSFYQVTDYVFGFGDAPPVAAFPDPADPGPKRQDFDEDSVDWKLGLNWTLNEDNYLYGVISRGHTTGSVNIFPPFDPYDEMVVHNFDAGWKATWADDQFTTQVAVYYEDIDGYQAAFTDLDIPSSAGQVQNAESPSTIYGIEFTGQARIEAFTLDFGLSWNESELGTFTNVVDPLTLEVVDLSGEPFPYAPQFTYNIGIAYEFTFGNGSTLTPRADWGWVDSTQGELFDNPEFLIAKHGLLNFNVRWDYNNWYVVGWMTNATDERYVAAIQNTGSLYYAGAPRQYGLRVGYNWY